MTHTPGRFRALRALGYGTAATVLLLFGCDAPAPDDPGRTSDVPAPTYDLDLSKVFDETTVDELPQRTACPNLEYPQMMQQAKIQGSVLLRFVVDTAGGVEPSSVEVLESTHKAFEGPAKAMTPGCRFRPGRVRGSAVRTRVQMPIIFALQGASPTGTEETSGS